MGSAVPFDSSHVVSFEQTRSPIKRKDSAGNLDLSSFKRKLMIALVARSLVIAKRSWLIFMLTS